MALMIWNISRPEGVLKSCWRFSGHCCDL